jgi:hypothetical protein
MKSLIIDRYHYIKNHDGCEEIYDIVNDPLELRELSGFREGQEVIEIFRNALNQKKRESETNEN